MPIILNKFREYQVSSETEILILGTFSPDTPDAPDFFFGRAKSFLWHLLPLCWGHDSLKEASLLSKQAFMAKYKIDFADLIDALNVPEDNEANMDDTFVDSHVHQWKDIIALIDTLPNLKAVYFTRKTFNGIPNNRTQSTLIANHCKKKNLRVCKLETPSRFFSPEKQQQWIDTIVLQNTCLRV